MADVQLNEKLQKIATEIEGLTVVEVADLAKYLEEKFGVTAVAAVALALFQHFLISLEFAAGKVDPFIDNVALLAIGIIFGGAGGQVLLNGTVKKVENLNDRVQTIEKVTNT